MEPTAEQCGCKGRTRVAYIDMKNTSYSCPGEFNLIKSPIRTCGGLTTPGCASANFSPLMELATVKFVVE